MEGVILERIVLLGVDSGAVLYLDPGHTGCKVGPARRHLKY